MNNSISRKEKALDLFQGGFNCAQAVLSAFIDELNLSEESALKITAGFGAGMGKLQNTCGAVSASFMIIGYLYGKVKEGDNEAKEITNSFIQEFAQKFTQIHGNLFCKSLIGYNLNDPKEVEQAEEADVFYKKCNGFVESAVEILEEILPDF